MKSASDHEGRQEPVRDRQSPSLRQDDPVAPVPDLALSLCLWTPGQTFGSWRSSTRASAGASAPDRVVATAACASGTLQGPTATAGWGRTEPPQRHSAAAAASIRWLTTRSSPAAR